MFSSSYWRPEFSSLVFSILYQFFHFIIIPPNIINKRLHKMDTCLTIKKSNWWPSNCTVHIYLPGDGCILQVHLAFYLKFLDTSLPFQNSQHKTISQVVSICLPKTVEAERGKDEDCKESTLLLSLFFWHSYLSYLGMVVRCWSLVFVLIKYAIGILVQDFFIH